MCNKRCKNYCVNDGTKLAFIIVYLLVTAAVFLERFFHYYYDPEKQFVREALSWSLYIARASAAAIKWNCALILIFVLRNFLTLRGTWFGTYFPVDKNIIFHKYIAGAILIWATAHICSHYMNYYKLQYGVTDQALLLRAGLISPDATGVVRRPTTWGLGFTTVPGATGHIATLTMIIMYTAAVDAVRRPSFEAFWYSHHLFVVFYGVLMGHGATGLLEPPNFYIWTLGPLVFYLIERTIRIIRGKQTCIVTQAIAHPSRVLELRMKKTTFNYKPGQYVFICCPYIADYEWHPFTISSSPDEDFVSLHIRLAGDWTGSLHQLMNPNKKGDGSVVQENMINAPNGTPIILIDGPFGAASEDVFKFETVMLFAAGIGVTPMASILKTVRYCIFNNIDNCLIKSVDFIWINREKTSFEWFLDLLVDLERDCDFLNIQLYFTGKVNKDEARDVEGGRDPITGLNSKTILGRPDIKNIFATKAAACQGKRVGVFFCGPPIVSKNLYAACKKFTDTRVGTRFIYHKENF